MSHPKNWDTAWQSYREVKSAYEKVIATGDEEDVFDVSVAR